MQNLFLKIYLRIEKIIHRVRTSSRGDVPGWVLITVMSAGLVTVLWTLADETLTDLFRRAIASVTGP